MRIYSMTATFGKLEHETLTFEPGLNIVEAPNEWGKSTWCAFLVAMLYGIDTGSRSTKTALADKERFAPWSGAPMSGRMELNWNGKDITIERSTRGRLILGDFRAYETQTGVDIPELTGANCGQMLLGVERSVFMRAGFLRLSDLPVTQDDSLRRRLNSLVTTGDESGSGDKLAQKLKDLKNKCRYNRSGLLPQAETQRDELQHKLTELQSLNSQTERLTQRQAQLEDMASQLENHKQALLYQEAHSDQLRVEQALSQRDQIVQKLQEQKATCKNLPSKEALASKLRAAQSLQDRWMALQAQQTPTKPAEPQIPTHYAGLPDAAAAARQDLQAQSQLEAGRKKHQAHIWIWMAVSAVIFAGLAAANFLLPSLAPWLLILGGGILIAAGCACLVTGYLYMKHFRREMDVLYLRHPNLSPDRWIADAEAFAVQQYAYQQELDRYYAALNAQEEQSRALQQEITALIADNTLGASIAQWNAEISAWDALENVQAELNQAENHAAALQAMVKTVAPPQAPDTLNSTLAETEALLARVLDEKQQNQHRLGQLQGQTQAMGTESDLSKELSSVKQRIERLENTYQALELAQRALDAASSELQRRFAPRISKRTQELFGKLTGGRYQRLTLGADMTLNAGAQDEDILRSAQWRSDGTIDQLYLALRLAVAEELTPLAPLVLDDALVRFDDQRLRSALEILKEAAQHKQVILFTCQSREKAHLPA